MTGVQTCALPIFYYSLPDLFYKLRAFYGDDVVAHFKNLCVTVLFDVRYLHDVLYVTLTSAEPLPDDIVEIIDEKTKQLVEEVNGRTSFWVKVDEELIGGLRLRIGDTVYDSTVTNHLYNLQKTLEKRPLHGDETPDEIVSDILTGISEIDTTIQEFQDRKSTRLNSSHRSLSRMPSSA